MGIEVPATLPVSITPGAKRPLIVNVVRVRVGGQWRPVKEWLLDVADEDLLKKRGVGLTTKNWWKLHDGAFEPNFRLSCES
jgi:hypothetical protein